MMFFIQNLIYIISVIGIFIIFYTLTDKDLNCALKKEEKKQKIIDIYTYNMDNEELNIFVKKIENDKDLNDMVDIVNIYKRFDK